MNVTGIALFFILIAAIYNSAMIVLRQFLGFVWFEFCRCPGVMSMPHFYFFYYASFLTVLILIVVITLCSIIKPGLLRFIFGRIPKDYKKNFHANDGTKYFSATDYHKKRKRKIDNYAEYNPHAPDTIEPGTPINIMNDPQNRVLIAGGPSLVNKTDTQLAEMAGDQVDTLLTVSNVGTYDELVSFLLKNDEIKGLDSDEIDDLLMSKLYELQSQREDTLAQKRYLAKQKRISDELMADEYRSPYNILPLDLWFRADYDAHDISTSKGCMCPTVVNVNSTGLNYAPIESEYNISLPSRSSPYDAPKASSNLQKKLKDRVRAEQNYDKYKGIKDEVNRKENMINKYSQRFYESSEYDESEEDDEAYYD